MNLSVGACTYNENLVTVGNLNRQYDDLKTNKVGQGDLVSDMQSGFISRCVDARLQISACSGYNLCQPG